MPQGIPDSPGWAPVVNTTIANYFRKVQVNILRSRILLAMLESKGRISYNNSGLNYNWKVQYKRGTANPYADGDTLTFARVDRHKTAEVPNDRAYIQTESMSWMDTLQNSGNEAIVKLWADKAKTMEGDVKEYFCDELYIDGNAAGNTKRIMGLETFFGAAATALAPGYVKPTDSYANLNTAPGASNGTWTNGTYPLGSGQPQYDFWSPILVDYTSPVAGAYTSSTRTWPNTCAEAMRNLLTSTRKQKAVDGSQIDLLLLEETLFKQYKNSLEGSKQIVYDNASTVAMRAMGFDVMSFDGMTLSTEFGIPDGVGYAINTAFFELKCMTPMLFESVGPVFDEVTQAYRWILRMAGNTVFNPKYFGKLKNYGQA